MYTDINTSPQSTFPLFYVGTPQHTSSGASYYKNATSRIWPILFMQSPKANSSTGLQGSGTSLSCLKTTHATQGSKALTGLTSSAGSRRFLGLPMLVMTGIGAAFVGLP